MNFPEIETLEDVEFIGPKNLKIRWMDEKEEEKKKTPRTTIVPIESEEMALVRFVREHLEFV